MAYDCILLKPSLKFLDQQASSHERQQILNIVESICADPHVDGITKFYFEAPPLVLRIYKQAEWWIVYYSPRKSVLHIVNIGRATEHPSIRRA